MEYNVKCPNCDAEQKHLSLDETMALLFVQNVGRRRK